ncbi:MAG: Hsp20/alpha crystallin family protein [Gammaproteobacteria bacterium]
MHTRRRTLLLSGLFTASILASLALGVTLGSSQLLRSSAVLGEHSEEDPKASLLEKLEHSAAQQAQSQAPQSLINGLGSGFSNSFFGNPMAQMQQMEAEMERIFSSFNAPGLGTGSNLWGSSFANVVQPQVDVQESDDEFRVVISLAENSELDLQTDLANNTLSISAQVQTGTQNSSGNRQMSSSFMSQFSRDIFLDAPVDPTGMQTEKSDSEVIIRIPKLS